MSYQDRVALRDVIWIGVLLHSVFAACFIVLPFQVAVAILAICGIFTLPFTAEIIYEAEKVQALVDGRKKPRVMGQESLGAVLMDDNSCERQQVRR